MKYLSLLLLAVFAVNCSSGGGSDPTESAEINEDVSSNPGDFEAVYTHRDDNCTYDVPSKFTVRQNGTGLLMTIQDNTDTLSNGDIFTGQVVMQDGNPVADFPDLDCGGFIVTDEAIANGINEDLSIELEEGDLLFVCSDFNSADEVCLGSFNINPI